MTLIANKLQLAVKSEGVEGTAETLAGTEVILAGNVDFDPDVTMTERPAASSSLSPFANVAGARMAKLSFDVELKGSGAAGTAPEYGDLLEACQMDETVSVGTSVTYLPDDGQASVTLAWYVDGKRWIMAGARGTFKLSLKAGQPGILRFEMTGTAIDDSDTALISASVSYDTTTPPPFLSAAMTLDSVSAVIETLDIDIANEVYLRPSANTAHGYVSAIVTGRKPSLTTDPETITVATKDWWASWFAGTLMAFTATVGATAGNICTITAPKVQYQKVKPANVNGVMRDQMECRLFRNSGDDELSLAFT